MSRRTFFGYGMIGTVVSAIGWEIDSYVYIGRPVLGILESAIQKVPLSDLLQIEVTLGFIAGCIALALIFLMFGTSSTSTEGKTK